MTLYGLAVFCFVYALAVASPGPGVAAIVARALARGFRGAPAFIAGFLAGDLVWFTLAATGLAALAQTAHLVFAAVKYAGAAYLLYLAWSMWIAAPQELDGGEPEFAQQPARAFLASFSLTMGNPKTMVFFLALLPTVVRLETLSLTGFIEIAVVISLVLPLVLGVYVLAAVRARRLLQSPRAVRMVNRGSRRCAVLSGAPLLVHRRLRVEQQRGHMLDLLFGEDAVVAEARHAGAGGVGLRVVDLAVGVFLDRLRGAAQLAVADQRRADGAEGDFLRADLVAGVAVRA